MYYPDKLTKSYTVNRLPARALLYRMIFLSQGDDVMTRSDAQEVVMAHDVGACGGAVTTMSAHWSACKSL
jgi:hypothetical protein